MTADRIYEIERNVIYKHIDYIMRELEECNNNHVVFKVGRRLGMMQSDLRKELDKEIEEQNK